MRTSVCLAFLYHAYGLKKFVKILEQRRSSVAGLTEYPTDSVHEEWQVGDTVQLRTEPFEL